jgi:hypothetical protein
MNKTSQSSPRLDLDKLGLGTPLHFMERGTYLSKSSSSLLHFVEKGIKGMRWLLLGFSILALSFAAQSYAMGSKPPVKKEPKYKLEILKMEFISAPTATREVKGGKQNVK